MAVMITGVRRGAFSNEAGIGTEVVAHGAAKCLGFLIGAQRQDWYKYFYTALVVLGAVVSLETVISLIDGAFALMAIPTMLATLRLSPRVLAATRDYFDRLRAPATP